MLLPSGPDTVRDSPLRGTRSSTPPGAAASGRRGLEGEFSPAGADCRYRAPLVPRLARREGYPGASGYGPRPHVADGVTRRRRRSRRAKAHRRGTLTSRRSRRRSGGEGGIRTLDGLPRTAFPVRRHSPLGDLSAGSRAAPSGAGGRQRTDRPSVRSELAERVGFEPTLLSQTAFRERHHQPLGHLSAREDSSGRPELRSGRRRRAPRPPRAGSR